MNLISRIIQSIQTKNKQIRLNDREYKKKQLQMYFLIPFIYTLLGMLLTSVIYKIGLLSYNTYIYILVFEVVIYMLDVIRRIYKTQDPEKILAELSVKTASKFLEYTLPDGFFKCPKHCRRKPIRY